MYGYFTIYRELPPEGAVINYITTKEKTKPATKY
jgi:hypothetical protein